MAPVAFGCRIGRSVHAVRASGRQCRRYDIVVARGVGRLGGSGCTLGANRWITPSSVAELSTPGWEDGMDGVFALLGVALGAIGSLAVGWVLQRREWRRREGSAGRALKVELVTNRQRIVELDDQRIRTDVFDRLLPELSVLMGAAIIDVFEAYRLLDALRADVREIRMRRDAGDTELAEQLELGLSQNLKHVNAVIADVAQKTGWQGLERAERDF